MSLMIDGRLQSDWLESEREDGEFIRRDSQFRNWVTADGQPGPTGDGGFEAEADRYHLYVSYACPWANRTLIFRAIKGLESIISVDAVDPLMPDSGWFFRETERGTEDSVNGCRHAHELYTLADPNYSGIVTVPILWDKRRRTIVNNESSEIIRMFNSAFEKFTTDRTDYYPRELQAEIDAINQRIYDHVNNGVYRCGFAATQSAYERAFKDLFTTLDDLEERLSRTRYLVGNRLTEADWRLFTTLVRFDPVYYVHFKCNDRRIADYPNLSAYMRELYQFPGVAETVRMDEIKEHYYASHRQLNPQGLVPLGPRQDLWAGHDRDRLPLD